MQTLTVANQKGGVGKTTTAVHLAVGLALQGHRVLVVDLDPQGQATKWLLGDVPTGRGLAEFLTGEAWDLREAQGRKGIQVLASTNDLTSAEITLMMRGGAEVLRRGLKKLAARFDFAVIDTPPNLGLLVINGLAAADAVVVPVLPNFASILGLAQFDATLAHVRSTLDLNPRLLGYLLFGVDARKALPAQSREKLEAFAPGRLMRSEIRVATDGEALIANRQTAWDAGADPRGAADYRAALAELLKRLKRAPRKVA